MILPQANRKHPAPWRADDVAAYRTRHLVENTFADLKQFRGIATRYCKLGSTFEEMLSLACWYVDTRTSRRVASSHQPPTPAVNG